MLPQPCCPSLVIMSSVDAHHAAIAVADTTDAPGARGSVDAQHAAKAFADTTVAAASMRIMLSRQEANRQVAQGGAGGAKVPPVFPSPPPLPKAPARPPARPLPTLLPKAPAPPLPPVNAQWLINISHPRPLPAEAAQIILRFVSTPPPPLNPRYLRMRTKPMPPDLGPWASAWHRTRPPVGIAAPPKPPGLSSRRLPQLQ